MIKCNDHLKYLKFFNQKITYIELEVLAQSLKKSLTSLETSFGSIKSVDTCKQRPVNILCSDRPGQVDFSTEAPVKARDAVEEEKKVSHTITA